MKPFLTNKGCLDNCEIMLRCDNEMITDDKRLAKLFNEHYINIVEQYNGLEPEKNFCHNEDFDKSVVLHNIIKKYGNHSSIIKIKNSMSVKSHLSFNNALPSARQVSFNEVNLILKSLNTKKAIISAYRKNYNTPHVMLRLLVGRTENSDKNYVAGGVLMDLSKAIYNVPYELLLEKLAAYGVDESFLCYIYSYLLIWNQCVRINNISSDFLHAISGVPQGSIVAPILFNCFFNDFFYVIETANAHNFADDNTLTAFAKNIS